MGSPRSFARERPEDHDQVEILLDEIPEELRGRLGAAVRYCPNRVLSIEEHD